MTFALRHIVAGDTGPVRWRNSIFLCDQDLVDSKHRIRLCDTEYRAGCETHSAPPNSAVEGESGVAGPEMRMTFGCPFT